MPSLALAFAGFLLAISYGLPGATAPASAEAPDAEALSAARTGVIVRGLAGNAMRYHLSLPNGWSRDRVWPVVLAITGSNANFGVLAEGYRQARGPLPFICLTPTTVSSTANHSLVAKNFPHLTAEELSRLTAMSAADRLAWDVAGVLRAIDDVHRHFAGESQVYLSGFSKGGHLAWHLAFAEASRLHMVYPSCAVFDPKVDVPAGPQILRVPILAFQGQADHLRQDTLEPCWDAALRLALARGYAEVPRLITFRGHSWHHEEILLASHGHYLARQGSRPDLSR